MRSIKSKIAAFSLFSLAFSPILLFQKANAGEHRFFLPLASIIKISPPAPELYQDLVCTPQDKAIIEEIVLSISQHTKWELIWEEGRINEMGVKITQVHPLKFLSTILLNPSLKMHVIGIFDDFFKRNGFLGNRLIGGRPADGLGTSLTREADKNKLDQYLNGFAKEINVPVDNIRPYFQMRDWENLVRYLILQ